MDWRDRAPCKSCGGRSRPCMCYVTRARVLNERSPGAPRRWLVAFWDMKLSRWCRVTTGEPVEKFLAVDLQSLDEMN
jgi:hypothetical protein